MKQVKVFAHRGASHYAPENTLPAFALAAEQGADGIELDVHLTKDGELVVIHDEKLDRTTNGTGWVKDYTLAELKTFCADNHLSGYPDARIPTLREVLELIRPTGLLVNIELKTSILWYDGIEEKHWTWLSKWEWKTGSSIPPSTITASKRSGSWTRRRKPPISIPTLSAMWNNTPQPMGSRTAPGTLECENGRSFAGVSS